MIESDVIVSRKLHIFIEQKKVSYRSVLTDAAMPAIGHAKKNRSASHRIPKIGFREAMIDEEYCFRFASK